MTGMSASDLVIAHDNVRLPGTNPVTIFDQHIPGWIQVRNGRSKPPKPPRRRPSQGVTIPERLPPKAAEPKAAQWCPSRARSKVIGGIQPYCYSRWLEQAQLVCFEEGCRARYPITEVIYNCPKCGGLLEAGYPDPISAFGIG